MLTALYTILVFCLIIAIHEFGHFAMAKLTGVTVHEFAIGMGPKLVSFSTKKTKYSLRLLPIGGYVKLEGEDEESDDVNAFCNKKPLQRLLVLFAGAFMNFVLGFILFIILTASSKGITTNEVDLVLKDSAFERAGVQSGDVIVKMEGENYKSKISDYNDINYFTYKNSMYKLQDSTVRITFERNGKKIVKDIAPTYVEEYNREMFGFQTKVIKVTFTNVIPTSYRQSKYVIKVVYESFIDLFRGRVPLSDMSGPVGIVNQIGEAAEAGMKHNVLQSILNVLYLAALISINLGVVNLLPFPALDGGRILFVLFEIILRRPIDRNKEGIFHMIGFVLLILLMIVITFSDIGRLFG